MLRGEWLTNYPIGSASIAKLLEARMRQGRVSAKLKNGLWNASIAQLVERDLAKVEVTSSNLVTRSNFLKKSAEWQSGHAADCKSVYLGSTPGSASIFNTPHAKAARCPGGGIGRHKGFKIPRQ